MPDHPDKLHLGCGLTTPPDWLNVDGSWNAKLSRHKTLKRLLMTLGVIPRREGQIEFDAHIFWHDLAKPLPWPAGSFGAVYASHTLEHLHLETTRAVLRECLRVLRPGGVCRMVVPDLRPILLEYAGQHTFPQPDVYSVVTPEVRARRPRADIVNMKMLCHSEGPVRGSLPYRLYSALKDFHSHKWMFDGESLSYYLREAGFVDVGERALHDSRVAGIEAVERPERVANGAGVAVEGIKPK